MTENDKTEYNEEILNTFPDRQMKHRQSQRIIKEDRDKLNIKTNLKTISVQTKTAETVTKYNERKWRYKKEEIKV